MTYYNTDNLPKQSKHIKQWNTKARTGTPRPLAPDEQNKRRH